ncbi:MAG: folate-binding protein YgfZ [Rickettsiaceae bacterium]
MFEVLNKRAVIQISGKDSQKFLQALTTNDIINNTYTYNYLLNNQGRYLFDFFVYKEAADNYFLEIEEANCQDFIKRLTLYKLRSEVEIKDISASCSILYSDAKIKDSEFSCLDPRYHELGFRSLIKTDKINRLEKAVSGLYLRDKYKYAIVDGCLDLMPGKSIPMEYGAEELSAIDYKKGCYIGQEVVSRAKYQGVIRKKIFKLVFGTLIAPISSGAEITDLQGDKIGLVCSINTNTAIALLREEKYLGLTEKKVIVGGCLADVAIPPWRLAL